PPRLMKARLETKGEGRTRLVPHAVVVAGLDAEGVAPRREVRVVRDALRARVHPVPVEAVEAVLEPDPPRNAKARRGVADLELPGARRDGDLGRRSRVRH